MAGRLRTLLAVGEIRGRVDLFQRVLDKLSESNADAVAVVGDVGAPWTKPSLHREMLKALGHTERPAFWVPGRWDGPLREILPDSTGMELAFPFLHEIHGSAYLGPGDVLFAGMGGEINDDPEALPGEDVLIRYAGWEVEHRLKVVRTYDTSRRVFLFTTSPARKDGAPGSETIAEMIKTYSPHVCVVGGDHAEQTWLGTTLVVCPGRAEIGAYALVDLSNRTVSFRRLVEPTEEESLMVKGARRGGESGLKRAAGRVRQLFSREQQPSPSLDFVERDDAYVVEIPDIERETVDIELEGNELAVDDRRIPLPAETDTEAVAAKFDDGTLTITVPKQLRSAAAAVAPFPR